MHKNGQSLITETTITKMCVCLRVFVNVCICIFMYVYILQYRSDYHWSQCPSNYVFISLFPHLDRNCLTKPSPGLHRGIKTGIFRPLGYHSSAAHVHWFVCLCDVVWPSRTCFQYPAIVPFTLLRSQMISLGTCSYNDIPSMDFPMALYFVANRSSSHFVEAWDSFTYKSIGNDAMKILALSTFVLSISFIELNALYPLRFQHPYRCVYLVENYVS